MDLRKIKTTGGAIIGGIVGSVFGLPGIVIGSTLGGLAARGRRVKDKPATSQRQIEFEDAMTKPADPAALRALATTYEAEGLSSYAWKLRARANLREAPEAVKAARRDVIKRAYATDDAKKILAVADAFEEIGAAGVANDLHTQAKAVRAAHEAGKAAKPTDAGTIKRFETAVVEAIKSFGPGSPQTTTAAANLIRAGGKKPDGPGVADMIAKAVAATGGMPAAVKPAVTPPEAVNPDEPSASPEAIAKAGAE